LFQDAGKLVTLAAHSEVPRDASLPAFQMERNQAICCGLLIGIVKFMVATVKLTESGDHGEVAMALSRAIFERAVNTEYLIARNDDRMFDRFVRLSLGPEKELADQIHGNIAKRGGTQLTIERQLLGSIDRVIKLAGVELADIRTGWNDWDEGFRRRVTAVYGPGAYAPSYRISSHFVHGTWVDIILNHIREVQQVQGSFVAHADKIERERIPYVAIALPVLRAASAYLTKYVGVETETRPLSSWLQQLEWRLVEVARATGDWDDASV
jgi:Family of unknown function (DUF5677)